MTLEIISAHAVLFKGEAEAVTLPGVLGSFTVLKNHAPIISVLDKGKVAYRTPSGEENNINIKGGIVDVADNVVAVCIY
ncbi:MAG: ATP synthase F1 subunit epsilon [Muribaculaceae bacterium]|nr:ATP synthase F1 subunit epsilon [Muribaculaceae bacterium]